jgi:hypothetical protein
MIIHQVNWDTAKRCFKLLSERSPAFFSDAVLIGGLSCWFYRNILTNRNDPDFPAPPYSEQEERLWLSKDIDFTNIDRTALASSLPDLATADGGIAIGGIPIGFAQVGLTIDAETAWRDSWIAALPGGVEVRVLDPIKLYREKQALVRKRGTPTDQLHLRLLEQFLASEVALQAEVLIERANQEGKTLGRTFLTDVNGYASEILANLKVSARLAAVAKNQELSRGERQLIQACLDAGENIRQTREALTQIVPKKNPTLG